ncbi:short chain type dehydrogenase [Aspergillus indologenus CBS 114.80]|uniref:Short chain type dehydrogenase n=1 Tax=Aspergillus indologenus CBS 114.80 TaxID=1450541 RepID=A0A2V5IWU7_9EURO|nr:short chain type dehydrogenase [Aspergillus indologenus CBS 114.80]
MSTTPPTLKDKVAIISGSSSGIGAAIARELSARGARVVVNYPFPSLQPQAESVVGSLPSPAIAVEADMSTASGPGQLVSATMAKWGRLDIVVNSVAVAVNKPLEEQTLDDWDALVNLNGRGTFLLTQASLKHLTRGGGRIVNICSLSARAPPPNQTIYAGTKGMVDSFTRCWAKELPPKYGCTVNTVSPGPTRTEGFAAAGEEQMRILQPTIDQTPVGPRMAQPEEIAWAVGFLCEERSRWINGVHLVASGGLFVD